MMIINLRYHLITVVAIFLSLGLGIFIGSSMGEDLIISSQRQVIELMEREMAELEVERGRLEALVLEHEEALKCYEELSARLWDSTYEGALLGRRIVIVKMAGTTNNRLLMLEAVLERAGAVVQQVVLDREQAAFGLEETPPVADSLLVYGNGLEKSQLEQLLDGLAPSGPRVIGIELSSDQPFFAVECADLDISAVDNVDKPWGRAALVAVLSGQSGLFGEKPGAGSLLPEVLLGAGGN